MVFDINKFKNLGQFRLPFESVGLVRFFGINSNYLVEIELKLEKDIKGDEFARWLVGLLGRKPEAIEFDDRDDINGEVLTEDELQKVSTLELEDFAKKLIDENKSLLKPSTLNNVENQENETACDSLLNLFKSYIDENKKRQKKMFESLSGGIFGKSTQEALLKNFDLSEQLRKTLEGVYGLSSDLKIEPLRSPLVGLTQINNPIVKTNEKLDQVAEILANSAPIAAQCASLIGSMNDAALKMQADYVKNAEETQWQTQLSILIATISLVVTGIFSYINYQDAKEDAKTKEEYIKQLKAEIELLKQSHSEGVSDIVKAIKDTSQSSHNMAIKNKK